MNDPMNEGAGHVDVFDEAADWFLLLEEKSDDADLLKKFSQWLELSPQHRLAWEKTCRGWAAFGAVETALRPQWGDAKRHEDKKRGSIRRLVMSRRTFSRVALGGVTLAMLCLAVMSVPDMAIRLEADYRTATGESRTVTLADGSTALLAPESALSVNYHQGRRDVKVLSGEVFFDVVRDEARPFVVDVRNLKVEVLGTAFDVGLSDLVTSVSLERGSVKASIANDPSAETQILVPGERVTVDGASNVMRKQAVPVEEIGAWRRGELYVVDETIGEVVEKIGRYHSAWISVPDRSLANRKVTGFYNLNEPDQALEALVTPYGGKIRSLSGAIRVVSRL
jgi:transmembrane sensor